MRLLIFRPEAASAIDAFGSAGLTQAPPTEPIAAGEAVFWEQGEEHETRTDTGLTAIVIEGEGVLPFRR